MHRRVAGYGSCEQCFARPGPDCSSEYSARSRRNRLSTVCTVRICASMVDLLNAKNTAWSAVQATMCHGRIDAARFPCGMFIDYLAIGLPRASVRADALAGFREGPFLVHHEDPQASRVEMPLQADGTIPNLSMADIRDVDSSLLQR